MSFTFSVTELLEMDGGSVTKKTTLANTGRVSIDEDIASNQTDKLVAMSLDVSACVAFYMVSDVAMQVETNATDHAGGNIITLVASIPYVWYTGKYDSFLLTSDVTKLYVTTTTAGNLKVNALYDATT